MKKTLFFGLLTFFSVSLIAQSAIDTYFKAHLDNPAFHKFEVTERSFDLVAEVETDDTEEQRVLDAISELDGIKVLSNETTEISAEYYQDAMAKFDGDAAYQDLVVVEHDDHNIRILIREDETAIHEFVVVAKERKDFFIASLYGNIDIASLSRVLTVLKNGNMKWIQNFEHLHNGEIVVSGSKGGTKPSLNTNSIDFNDLQLSIFPNPAADFINVTAKNGQAADLKIAFYSLSGKEIQDIGAVELPYKVGLNDLPTGTYFLRLTDQEGQFKNFKIVKAVE